MYEFKDGIRIKKTLQAPTSKTYEEVSLVWLDGLYEQLKNVPEAHHLFTEAHDENDEDVIEPLNVVREGVIRFAHYLDKFNSLTLQLEVMALYKAREMDRELMLLMVDALGKEKTTELARQIQLKYKMLKQAPSKKMTIDGVRIA